MNEALAQGISAVIQYLGPSPVLFTIVILGIAPWAAVVWAIIKLSRALGKISSELTTQSQQSSTEQNTRMQQVFERQDQRFEQVVKMYEDNVDLVKAHQSLVENQRETNDKLIDLVSISTSTQQTLVEYIKNNWWCPIAKDPALRNKEIRG